MKKIYSFMVAAVALFAAASCNKELPQENLPAVGETVVYTASTDGADTKAVLDETVSKWCGEELITLHDGTNAFTFYANAGETPVSKVDFTYTKGEGQPEFTATEVMAVYPSGDYTASISDKTVSNVVVPNNQTLADNTYHATAAVAVAYSTTTELSFKNATTLLKFKVAGDDVTYGCIAAEGDISGTFDLAYNGGEPELTATTAYQWVDFSKNDDFLSKEATYYIAVAPAALNKITMYLNGAEVKSKTFEEPYQLKRNVILDLGTITYTAPETASTVYLKPGVWSADGAWYVAYFFNSTGNVAVMMEDTDADGLFEATVPEGKYSKVIFCRVNPEATEFVWESVWNQTENLTVPTSEDEKLCYVINGWESAEWQTVEDSIAPVTPVEKEWGIVGTMTDWSDNIPMTLVDGWYVAENVTIKTSDEFKFRVGTTWDELKTYNATTIVDDTEYPTVDGQGDGNGMKVAVSAIYSVYLSDDAATMKVVKTGDIPLPEVKNWGIVGSITSWGAVTDITMALEGDWYIAHAVEMPAGTEFKFRVDNKWASDGGEELTYAGSVVSGTEYNVSGGASNISITSGAVYDVYLSHDETKMKVVKVADLPEPDIMAKDGYVYLLPNSNWTQASARFAIYFYGNGETWVSMTKVEGTNYYGVKISDIISKGYTGMIFCRMNPGTVANNWDNKWDQTGDLTVSTFTSGKNCFSVPNGSWSGATTGWSTVEKLN